MAVCDGRMMRAIPAMILALGLAACSTAGDAPAPAAADGGAPSFGQKVTNLLLLGDANAGPAPAVGSDQKEQVFCPEIGVQPGTAAWQSGASGAVAADPFSVRYQGRFGKLVRACDVIRIGFAGRVVVGPKGESGTTQTLPVRIVLLDNDDKPVFSRLERVAVAIPPGAGGADFAQVVQTDSMPIPPDHMSGWRLKIGFDTAAAKAPAKGGRHRRARHAG